jgi:hypothetical protein
VVEVVDVVEVVEVEFLVAFALATAGVTVAMMHRAAPAARMMRVMSLPKERLVEDERSATTAAGESSPTSLALRELPCPSSNVRVTPLVVNTRVR